MTTRTLLLVSALASGALALCLLLIVFDAIAPTLLPASLRLYAMGLGLMQAIFTIWYWKGSREQNFALWSGRIRAVLAVVLAAGMLFPLHAGIPQFWRSGMLYFAAVEFALGGLLLLAGKTSPLPPGTRGAATGHYRNRFFFAFYMVALSAWIVSHPDSFVAFFRLPAAATAEDAALLHSLLFVFSLLLLQLALFTFVAVRYRIAVLIEAGVRGGLVTCIVVAVLVVLRVAHPLVLLIPAVDLVSIAAIALGKLRQHS